MKKVTASIVLALLGLIGTAHAETPPSAWDRAKRPEVQDEYQLHLTVRQVLISEELTPIASAAALKQEVYARVLAMLQAAGAAKSQNAILRYDLADLYMKTSQFARAAETYKSAMADFPNHPQTRHSRFELAIACGHIGDHECEERMYRAVVAQSSSPAEIATPALNLAETEMHNHDLREAIEDYREALRLCGFFQSGAQTPSLILWGLAVALDRAGETREADEQAHRALDMVGGRTEIAQAILNSEGVFFFPDYEVRWYEALTFAAAARRAQTPKQRLELWLQAERRMLLWVTGGEKKKDYWLPIAKTRLEAYAKERKAAEAVVFKNPPHDDDEDETPIFVPPPPPKVKPPPVPPTPAPKPRRPGGDVTL